MRRRLAVALCLLGVALAMTFAYQTWRCGMRSVSETCTSAEDCEARSSCVSHLHPMALPYTLLGMAGAALAWRGLAGPLIVSGIVGLAIGVAFGLSMGFVGIGVGALVLAAGLLVMRRGDGAARPGA